MVRLSVLLATFASKVVFGRVVPRTDTTCADGQVVRHAECCALFPVLHDVLEDLFDESTCGEEAHESLRLVFHDAIGFSKTVGGGGADGSIITFFDEEMAFESNTGLDGIINIQRPFIEKHNMTPGDFIQFAGAVSVAICPGAPRLEFLLGRPVATEPSPPDMVPEPFHNVTTILERMADAGFDAAETVALLASHSVAGQDSLDTTVSGAPFDSSHDIFDPQFFVEVLLKGKYFPGTGTGHGEAMNGIPGGVRIQSDADLARDPRTACLWQEAATHPDKMNNAFAAAMAKLATLGQDRSKLIDCSDVLPQPPPLPESAKPHLPPGLTMDDIETSCADIPFPTLPALPGPETSLPPIPPS